MSKGRSAYKVVEAATLALLVATVFMVIELVFLFDMGFRSGNPAALLFILGLRAAAEWVVLIYPFFLLWLFTWQLVALGQHFHRILTEPNWFDGSPFAKVSFALLTVFSVYLTSVTAYALYLWTYASCVSVDNWLGIGIAFQCNVLPTYSTYSTLAVEQFLRGMAGDFFEIVQPVDTLAGIHKDPLFISVTAMYRLFAQTALFALPLSLWYAVTMPFRRQ